MQRAAAALLGPGHHVVAGRGQGVDGGLLDAGKRLAHHASAQDDGGRPAGAPPLPGHRRVRVERFAAASRRAGHEARQRPAYAQREREHARPSHEREQRTYLERGRLRAAVARDLEHLAVLDLGRARDFTSPAAEAAIERAAPFLDGEVARDEPLHDVDAAAGAVRLGREQVEGGAGGQAEPARDALARERIEALAPLVREVESGHTPTARSTFATSSGLAGFADRAGVSAPRGSGARRARRRPAS